MARKPLDKHLRDMQELKRRLGIEGETHRGGGVDELRARLDLPTKGDPPRMSRDYIRARLDLDSPPSRYSLQEDGRTPELRPPEELPMPMGTKRVSRTKIFLAALGVVVGILELIILILELTT